LGALRAWVSKSNEYRKTRRLGGEGETLGTLPLNGDWKRRRDCAWRERRDQQRAAA
jgi:hypothetical protein